MTLPNFLRFHCFWVHSVFELIGRVQQFLSERRNESWAAIEDASNTSSCTRSGPLLAHSHFFSYRYTRHSCALSSHSFLLIPSTAFTSALFHHPLIRAFYEMLAVHTHEDEELSSYASPQKRQFSAASLEKIAAGI